MATNEPSTVEITARMRLALTALTANQFPDEVPALERVLLDLGPTLNERAWALHQWLDVADDYLTAHRELTDYRAREEQWVKRLEHYTAAMAVLGEALVWLGRRGFKPVTMVDEPMRQEGLL